MTPLEEHNFEVAAEKMLRGHRQAPNGRNFLAFTMRYQNNQGYKVKFDSTFPSAPGSRYHMDTRYCPICDKLLAWCECKK